MKNRGKEQTNVTELKRSWYNLVSLLLPVRTEQMTERTFRKSESDNTINIQRHLRQILLPLQRKIKIKKECQKN